MRTLFLLAILAFNINAFAQLGKKKTTKYNTPYVSPKLLDVEKFSKEIVCLGDLKNIYESLKKDTEMFYYPYFFTINKSGKVQIRENKGHGTDNTLFFKLNHYINERFDKYHWKAGYLKKCKTCKKNIFMQLHIFFMTNLNKITIEIVMTDSNPDIKLYERDISYQDLSFQFLKRNCSCGLAK